jgi:hypothetical protein
MSRGLEVRLSRIEQCAAERTEKPLICNCRESTRYHNSACLAELLRKMPRVCQVHGFRDLGHFLWLYPEGRLLQEDTPFCPCVVNPWNAFIRGPGPHTIEGLYVVQEAFCKETLPEYPDFDDEGVLQEIRWEKELQEFQQGMRLIDDYDKALGRWLWDTGQIPSVSRRELARLESQRVRRHKELLREVANEYITYSNARKSV